MIKGRLNIRGETLVETIIALSILAVGISVSSTVIMNSIRNLSNAKNRVIAVNLAREGIEAVRSIRDSNWLFYSDRRRLCWNHDPGSLTPCDSLDPGPILPGTYIVYLNTDGSWRLQLADANTGVDGPDADIEPDNDLDLIPLSLADRDVLFDSDNADKDGDVTTNANDDEDFYNHMDAGVTNPLGAFVRTTVFTRYVVIEYLPNQPPPIDNIVPPDDSINTVSEWNSAVLSGNDTGLNRMRVTSVVGWKVGGASHSSKLITILTDHLGREELDN